MRNLLAIIVLCCGAFVYGQSDRTKLATMKYAGIYTYGNDPEKGETGRIIVYPETDATVLFYLEVNRGEPSYNTGSLYGRLTITKDEGIFEKKFDDTENACKWKLVFSNSSLDITTLDGQHDCGFGFGVYVDGEFERKSKTVTPYFLNAEERKIFFDKISPEEYNR